MEHTRVVCKGGHEYPGCMFCDGGLYACSICGTMEGAVPSECPGYIIPLGKVQAIYAGELDYKDGKWIEGACSPASPKYNSQRQVS